MKTAAIILAGGSGQRVKRHDIPKQLVRINDRPIISYCLEIYQGIEEVHSIILVINEEYRENFNQIVELEKFTKVSHVVSGGVLRSDSVYNGLMSIKDENFDLVLIQNGVSIFTLPDVIKKCIEKAEVSKAVTAGDTVSVYTPFYYKDDHVVEMLEKKRIGYIRDPQCFHYKFLVDLHERMQNEETGPFYNDAIMCKHYREGVALVPSNRDNFKITYDFEIFLAEFLIKKGKG